MALPGKRRDDTRPPAAHAAAFGGVQVLGVAACGVLGAREQTLKAPALAARIRELLAQPLDFAAEVDDLTSGRREVALGFRRSVDGGQSPLEQRRQSVTLLLGSSQAPQLS